MATYKTIRYKNTHIKDIIELPLSKSISNRQLMIFTYANWDINELEISTADDSVLLKNNLLKIAVDEKLTTKTSNRIHCKNAGTVARFILPYLCTLKHNYILESSDRMKLRPLMPLVESLNNTGADIISINKDNRIPFSINPSKLGNNKIEIDISDSSQFATALLMMMPSIAEESTIVLNGDIASMPYINLTLEIMKFYGIDYSIDNRFITLKGSYIKPEKKYKPERDWSSASYFYELLALKKEGELLLKDLRLDSLQGDRQLAIIFEKLGVESIQLERGVLIRAGGAIDYNQNIDFSNTPDLAPAVICTCAALGTISVFTGLQSLNHKESRRMDVLCAELDKLGYDLRDNGMNEYVLLNSCKPQLRNVDFSEIIINTANDHRMAMAFAPMAIIGKGIKISNPECVDKSFPDYWNEIKIMIEEESVFLDT